MVIMVLAGKQATGYLPAGGEYQISARVTNQLFTI
jgi:hypothetical protein